ncbi:MAG TPA: threonine synthase, partial [Chloroflexi bacterium]|nr:threonine synthase [Chloroflexota bacterium]
IVPQRPDTIAKSLAIGTPADGPFALRAIRSTGGQAVAVTDREIIEGIKLLARTEGIFAETAAGVTVATLKQLAEQEAFDPDEVVVAYVTGNGLKTTDAVLGHLTPVLSTDPTLRGFENALGRGVYRKAA